MSNSKTISKCYICDKNISSQDTYEEHIILNSLGGRLKSKSLICQQCARSLDRIDVALSAQLNWVGLLLDIERDRKKNPPIQAIRTDTGEQISLDSGGKPVLIKPTIKDNLADNKEPSLYIAAKNQEQMEEIGTGLKRKKHPSLNVEKMLEIAVTQKEYIPLVNIKASFGDEECCRSICKMAINFYMYHGGKRDLIAHLIPYIKDGGDNQYVWYYYPDSFTAISQPEQSFIHTLFIKGNPQEKILYAYIEFYNAFKLIILLSDSYNGGSFQKVYSFDVLSREEVNKEININLSRKEILNLVKNRPEQLEKIAKAIKDLKDAIQLKQMDKYLSSLAKKTIEEFFKNIPENPIFDETILRKFASKLGEDIGDFMDR